MKMTRVFLRFSLRGRRNGGNLFANCSETRLGLQAPCVLRPVCSPARLSPSVLMREYKYLNNQHFCICMQTLMLCNYTQSWHSN